MKGSLPQLYSSTSASPKTMEPDQEFGEFVKLLESHGVKYVIIGGYAVISHGHPRYTGDIDFFVEKSPENARKLVKVINEFFGPQPHITEDCFLDDDRMSQFGAPPYRIDVLVNVPGIEFADVAPQAIKGKIGGTQASIIDLPDLIKSKKAAGRHKDLGDLEALVEIQALRDQSSNS
jgi:predicted nucleotidyltransferase